MLFYLFVLLSTPVKVKDFGNTVNQLCFIQVNRKILFIFAWSWLYREYENVSFSKCWYESKAILKELHYIKANGLVWCWRFLVADKFLVLAKTWFQSKLFWFKYKDQLMFVKRISKSIYLRWKTKVSGRLSHLLPLWVTFYISGSWQIYKWEYSWRIFYLSATTKQTFF